MMVWLMCYTQSRGERQPRIFHQHPLSKKIKSSFAGLKNILSVTKLFFPNSENDPEVRSKWNEFVESIKSKLTVKQVVDGVRAGGSISFDYILLIVTAE